MRASSLVTLVGVSLAAISCSGAPNTDPGWEPRETDLAPPWQEGTETCDASHTPIIMAHGFLASGDTFANHVMRFVANGYCQDRLFVYDWNSLGGGDDPELLDDYVDEVLRLTGASQVDLMGHSAGGGLGYEYLEDATRAGKVRRYVHIGSSDNDAPAGPEADVPTLNLYSAADRIVSGNDGIDGATNVDLETDDHYEVATSAASFEAIWRFLGDGSDPTTSAIEAEGARVVLAGRAVSLGDNTPTAGATVDVYEVDEETGQRLRATPRVSLVTTEGGYWGPVLVEAGVPHELHITPTEGLSVHYYREPFVRSNTKLYLRTLPTQGLGAFLLGAVTFTDAQPTSVIFLANRGLQPGDAFSLDDLDLSGERFTDPDATNIALFFYDENLNDESDETPIAVFEAFPFLIGTDYAPGAGVEESSVVELNGRRIAMPRWPGESGGASIAVFE